MASDNQIVLEITLDDGSVQRGFAKVKTSAKDTAKSVEGEFSKVDVSKEVGIDKLASDISSLGSKMISLVAGPLAALTASYLAIKTASEAAFRGEQLEKTENLFRSLSAQAGVTADTLKDRLSDALGGVVDDSDALELVNQALIRIGSNAEKAPQLFELARRSANAFGGEATEKFEALINAIETGNTKALKQAGLYFDLAKVFDEYAKSIGKSTSELSASEKQQIATDAILSRGEERFKNIPLLVGGATEAYRQFKVTLSNLGEEIDKAASKSTLFESFFNSLKGFAQGAIDAINITKGGAEGITTEIRLAEQNILAVEKELAETSLEFNKFLLNQRLDQLKSYIAERKEILSRQEDAKAEQDFINGVNNRQAVESADLDFKNSLSEKALQNIEAYNKRKVELEIESQNAIFQSQLVGASLEDQARINKEKAEFEHKQRLAQIEKDFKNEAGISNAMYNQLVETENQRSKSVIEQIEKDSAKKIADEKARQRQRELQATSTALGQIATLQENATGELAEIGKAAAITKATIDGYLAVQNALAQVPYPFNFAAAALVGVAAAANVAKIASAGGGGGGSAAFSPSTTGGGVTSPTSPETATPVSATERQAQTGIVVNIQGDVLGDDSAGERIVSLINSAFDQKGVVVRQGAFA